MVQEKRDDMVELCRRFHVRSLELFGSGTCEEFAPDRSDLDFLVEFEPCRPSEHYERYFGLRECLHELFGRNVDLVEVRAVRNPYFLRRANESREPIYVA
jgi:predicted nucleotidyltransferase